MSEQENTYTDEQFEAVRRARHAVRKALSKFHKFLDFAGVDAREVHSLSRKSYRAMQGKPGYTQDEQVQRFDWVTENTEGMIAALNAVEASDDEFDARLVALAKEFAEGRVKPVIAEGRAIAADRDFESYKAAKDAKRAEAAAAYAASHQRDYAFTDSGDEDGEDEG